MTENRLSLFDTLTHAPKTLSSGEPSTKPIGVYCCGPTVYDVAHVGHARAALTPDLLVRHLRADGHEVKYVRNITDVDDKILKRSSDNGEEPLTLSARMAILYQEDMRRLGCVEPDVEPRVSATIPEIIALVERLIANGSAYAVKAKEGGDDVYFAVRTFQGYGKLSKRKIEDLIVGARIEANDEKRDPLDFALWKGCETSAWGWESPWGKGRPGWHIECSAMSSKHLGHGFDVHCGGMDLIFPHHENEIAQSEGAYPDEGPFSRLWIHNGFVNIDKEKMAKSLGNFVTVRDVYERNDPEALRYFLMTVHYRGPIAFDTQKLDTGRVVFPGVVEAERRVDYLYLTTERLEACGASSDTEPKAPLPKELSTHRDLAANLGARVRAALDDDLNSPIALGALADAARAANELVDLATKRKKDAGFVAHAAHLSRTLLTELRSATARLGILQTPAATYFERTRTQRLAVKGITEATVHEKIAERVAARVAKDFARGDAIRGELAELGVELFDGPEGTTFRINV